jgi:chromosome segregation ATPase
MTRTLNTRTVTWLVLPLLLITGNCIAWQPAVSQQQNNKQLIKADTTPKKRQHRNPKNIDEVITEIEDAREDIEKEMNTIDFTKIQAEAERSIHEINLNKIKEDIKNAMKDLEVNLHQIEKEKLLQKDALREMEVELKNILSAEERAKIKEQVEKSVAQSLAALDEAKKINKMQIKEEMQQALAQVDMQKEQLAKQLEEMKVNMGRHKINAKEQIEKAKVQLEQTKAEMQGYKTMLDEMAKEGLIDKEKNYKIVFKNNQLVINGITQPENILEKYKSYFKPGKETVIQKNEEGFTINHSNVAYD